MLKFQCPDCGPQETMLFDASCILERQFEGVEFVLKHDANGNLVAEAPKEHADYLKDYNMAKHLAAAVEIASDEPSPSSARSVASRWSESVISW